VACVGAVCLGQHCSPAAMKRFTSAGLHSTSTSPCWGAPAGPLPAGTAAAAAVLLFSWMKSLASWHVVSCKPRSSTGSCAASTALLLVVPSS
jgi:hypothetical protein